MASPPFDSPDSLEVPDDETAALLRRDAPEEDDDELDVQLQLANLRRRFAGAEVEPVRFRHWEVERRLGKGGMGAVYLARDPELDRRVALKILAPVLGSDHSRMNQRLRREAQALARIEHANVVKVHGVDLYEGRTVIEMEYVDGPTLRLWQAEPRRWREVVAVYASAGDGLVAMHAAGLVHRDVKPDNLLMLADGQVKVVDLGLAVGPRVALAGSSSTPSRPATSAPASMLGVALTEGSSIVGTPGYMAPEQFGRDEATPACDQFSLAVSLYEALMGVPPFAGKEPSAYAMALRRGTLQAPERAPELPRWLTRALQRALRFEPANRYSSMAAFVGVLRDGLARRRRWLLGLGGLAGLMLLPTAGWVSREPAPDPCAPLQAELAAGEAEDSAMRERLRRRIAIMHAPHLDHALRAFDGAIERHTDQWTRTRLDLCEAQARSDAAGEASSALLDRQRGCLEHARARFEDVLVAVGEGQHELADRMIAATTAVERLPACNDSNELARWPLEPSPRVVEATAQALRLELAGDYAGAEAKARAAVQASATAHPRFQAEARYRLGHILGQQERGEQAFAEIERARNIAFEAGHDGLFCEAVGFQAKLAAALALDPTTSQRELGLARACVERTGLRSPLVLADLLEAEGLLALAAHDPAAAVHAHEQALAVRREHLGPEHYEVSKSLHNLANAQAERGELELAHERMLEALRLRERLLGSWHPGVARILFDLAELELEAGALVEARAGLLRAGAILRRAHGPAAPALASAHLSLARVELRREHPDVAFGLAQLERARELQGADLELSADHPDRAALLQTEGSLVVVATSPNIDFARALEAYAGATEILRRHDPRSPAVLDGTLKEIEMLYGLLDHTQLAARVAAEGPGLAAYLESLAPSVRGPLAWYAGDSSVEAGRFPQAAKYLRIALDAYRELDDPTSVDVLAALLLRAQHPTEHPTEHPTHRGTQP